MEIFPQLTTERLCLNALQVKDIPAIVTYAADVRITQYTLNIPTPYAEKDAVYWLNMAQEGFKEGTHFIFAIRKKAQQDFMGGIGLTLEKRFNRAEIGYWLAVPFWNQGYITEATKALIQFGFEQLHLNKITSSHFEENPASGKVLQKSGLQKEGVLKEHVFKEGRYYNLVVYGLTQQDFAKQL